MNQDCPFCMTDQAKATVIREYQYWNLFLQSTAKRQETKQAAGFLALRRHVERPVDASAQEWAELQTILVSASEYLCQQVGVTYVRQETIGFNQGAEAGQTVAHAHIHILPVAAEDPAELKVRGGIGGAFEALRRERLGE